MYIRLTCFESAQGVDIKFVCVTYRDKTHQTSDIKRALGHGHGAWGLGHGAREREMRGEAGTAPADKVKWRRQ